MALDTKEKRLSMMNFGRPPTFPLFEADGSVDKDDRAHLLNLYSGISLDPPSTGPGGVFEGDSFNNVKVEALVKVTGLSMRLANNLLEFRYLGILTGGAGSTLAERWSTVFDLAGIPGGDFDDRAYAWLGSLGHTADSVHRRWYNYWLDLGS